MSHNSRQLAYFLHGKSQNDADIYVMIHASPDPVEFGIQEGAVGDWRLAVDTSFDSEDEAEVGTAIAASTCTINGRSVVVLVN